MQILIVDDHALFRRGLAHALLDQASINHVFEAHSATTAMQKVAETRHQLDLVILDYNLPDSDGIALMQQMHVQDALLPVVMLSASEDPMLIQRTMQAGCSGFLSKSLSTTRLMDAIEQVVSGGIYLPVVLQATKTTGQMSPVEPTLTARQHDVLGLIRFGLPNKEIAWRLGISEATVKAHVSIILKRYGVNSRTQLVLAQAHISDSLTE